MSASPEDEGSLSGLDDVDCFDDLADFAVDEPFAAPAQQTATSGCGATGDSSLLQVPHTRSTRRTSSLTTILTKRKSLDDQELVATKTPRRARVAVLDDPAASASSRTASSSVAVPDGSLNSSQNKEAVEALIRVRSTVPLSRANSYVATSDELDILRSAEEHESDSDDVQHAASSSGPDEAGGSSDGISTAARREGLSEDRSFEQKIHQAKVRGTLLSEVAARISEEEKEDRAFLEALYEPLSLNAIDCARYMDHRRIYFSAVAMRTQAALRALAADESAQRSKEITEAYDRSVEMIDGQTGMLVLELAMRASLSSTERSIRRTLMTQLHSVQGSLLTTALEETEFNERHAQVRAEHESRTRLQRQLKAESETGAVVQDEHQLRAAIAGAEQADFSIRIITGEKLAKAFATSGIPKDEASGRRRAVCEEREYREEIFHVFAAGRLLIEPDGILFAEEQHVRRAVTAHEAAARAKLLSSHGDGMFAMLQLRQALARFALAVPPLSREEEKQRARVAKTEADAMSLLIEAHQRELFRERLRLQMATGKVGISPGCSTDLTAASGCRRLSYAQRRVSLLTAGGIRRRSSTRLLGASASTGGAADSNSNTNCGLEGSSREFSLLAAPPLPPPPALAASRTSLIASVEATSRRSIQSRWERGFREMHVEELHSRSEISAVQRLRQSHNRCPPPPANPSPVAVEKKPHQPLGPPRCADVANLPPRLRCLKLEASMRRDELKQMETMKRVVQDLIAVDIASSIKAACGDESRQRRECNKKGPLMHPYPFTVSHVVAAPPAWDLASTDRAAALPAAAGTPAALLGGKPLQPHPPPSLRSPRCGRPTRTRQQIRDLAARLVLKRHVEADRKRVTAEVSDDTRNSRGKPPRMTRDDDDDDDPSDEGRHGVPRPTGAEEAEISSSSSSSSRSSSSRSSSLSHSSRSSSSRSARSTDDNPKAAVHRAATSTPVSSPRYTTDGFDSDVSPAHNPAGGIAQTEEQTPCRALEFLSNEKVPADSGSGGADEEQATSPQPNLAASSSSSSSSSDSWHPMSAERADEESD
jgi:hypothetical protein